MFLFHRQMLLLAALGFFSGLPLALTASTLTAWLADAGISRAAIGLFAAIGVPYALKFLWAPLVDALRVPLLGRLGRRRSWLLLVQALLALALAVMGSADPASAMTATACAALTVATLSATQDIVIDAYRVELLAAEQQGMGAAASTFGYRIGMLVSGAGALALAEITGWHTTYLLMAALMGSAMLVTLLAKERNNVAPQHQQSRTLDALFIAPLRDFMTRPHWLAVLLFVILYKLGDAMLGVMFNPFLLDIGFSKIQIAEIVKLYGLIATLAGSFLGGWMVTRLGAVRTMLWGGIIHSAANLLLIPQAHLGADVSFLIFNTIAINLTGGAGLAAFVAYLAGLCGRNYTATHYALLSALSAVGRTVLSTPSGWLAASFGWPVFFILCAAFTVPGLVLAWWLEVKLRQSRGQ